MSDVPAGVPGGPGWIIRDSDLRPHITDLAVFRRDFHNDPLAKPIELLWTNRPEEARVALDASPQSVRVRALRADCLRDLGQTDRAVAIYDALLRETVGSSREAFIRQHRGKALLEAGKVLDAQEEFARVVELRTGGDPALFTSASQAFKFASRAGEKRDV